MPLWLDAIILGIVEGLSEFLPISSTGHLIITRHLFDMPDNEAFRLLDVVIQSGAAFAVIWHYRVLLLEMLNTKRDLAMSLVVACVPAVLIGFLFHKWIKSVLFAPMPVVGALVVGGVAMIVMERKWPNPQRPLHTPGKTPTLKEGFLIGVFQCLAMWPGTSRSMTTILGARFLGFTAREAAEFSFLLSIPMLLGASALDIVKSREVLFNDSTLWLPFALAIVSAFIVSLVVIRAFLKFLARYSLEIFGWYRIVFGLFLWFLWAL